MSDRAALFYFVARISEDNGAEPVDLTSRVQSFTFVDREMGMDRLTLTVDNKDLANFDDPLFETGAKIRVGWGNGQSAAPLRDMVIKKVTGGRTLQIEAVSKMGTAMDTEKRRRCFAAVTRSDVARQIAKENGFQNPDIEDTPEVFNEISQGNLSDGQFLRKLAHLEGFEFYVDWEGFHWHRRRVGQAPVREYIYFTDPAGGEVIDFNITNDVTRRPGRVRVKSRDPYAKEDIDEVASNSEDRDRDVMQDVVGTIDGETGQLTLKTETAHETTIATNVETAQDASREAKGKFRRAAQGAVKMTLKLRGDPSLVAKTVITLKGMGKRISGKYYVQEVTHTLSASGGYDMDLKLITDGFQRRGGGAGGDGGGAGDVDSPSSILGLSTNLEAALAEDYAAEINGETGELLTDFTRIEAVSSTGRSLSQGLKALASQQGDQLRSNAALAAKAFRRLAGSAKAASMPNTASQAGEIAATLDRIAAGPAEAEAQGNKNTKGPKDGNVTPVQTTDADGNPITQYVDTGGRTK